HGEDSHARIGCFFRRLYRIAAQFLAVGKDDERAIPCCAFAEALHRESNGTGNIGAALGNRFRVQIIDGLNYSIVINRKWGLQKSAPGKGDETDTIALRSEEHTSELQSRFDLVCRLLLVKKNLKKFMPTNLQSNP